MSHFLYLKSGPGIHHRLGRSPPCRGSGHDGQGPAYFEKILPEGPGLPRVLPRASNLIPMASNLEAMVVMASDQIAMASNRIPMASNLEAMVVMASNLIPMA